MCPHPRGIVEHGTQDDDWRHTWYARWHATICHIAWMNYIYGYGVLNDTTRCIEVCTPGAAGDNDLLIFFRIF